MVKDYTLTKVSKIISQSCIYRGHRGHDRMVVGFTTTCEISTDHH
jgi:hypothetical protein